jgi:hypothetical protein
MGRAATNPFLLRQLARGEYVVDAHAVADAIITRMATGNAGAWLSGVLVPAELAGGFSVGPEEAGPRGS